MDCGQDSNPVNDFPVLYLGDKVIMYRRLGLGPFIFLWRLAPSNEPGAVQIGVVGTAQPSAGRVVRAAPSFAYIVDVAERVKCFLPAGWKSVHGFAGAEFRPGNDEV